MVLLIDANIIIDVLVNRQPFTNDSSLIWKLCETEQVKGYVSALTFANIVYILRKELSSETIEMVFRKMKLIFTFAELSPIILEKAIEMRWNDFEDAVQSATADHIHADYIITRNDRDFAQSKVLAITPSEFLAKYH